MKWTKETKKEFLRYVEEGFEPYIEILEENGKEIETNYGLDCIALTDEHIKAIKDGKCLNCGINGEEYAAVIFYKDGE